jgi:glycosyltransferase involved in cell wall biosynthesis
MRILMPLLTLVPDHMGGSERCARELVKGLADAGADVTVVVNRAARGWAGTDAREVVLEGWSGADTVPARLHASVVARVTARSALGKLPRPDLVHYPLTVPAPPAPTGLPVVQTILDTQHLDLPHLFSTSERAYRRLSYDAPARRVDAVITISEFSRSRVIERLGVPDDRVHVAPLGVAVPSPAAAVERENFVLYPARLWPHKNHGRLVDAVGALRRSRPDLRLVLTGGGLDGLGELPDWVERRGHVTDDELWALYRKAGCVAFPSLYEGFGMPPLEAMSQGCPVAASDIPAIREVCGAAAVLFDPLEVASIAQGVAEALDQGTSLREAGLARAAAFTWKRFVDAHLAVYDKVTSVEARR